MNVKEDKAPFVCPGVFAKPGSVCISIVKTCHLIYLLFYMWFLSLPFVSFFPCHGKLNWQLMNLQSQFYIFMATQSFCSTKSGSDDLSNPDLVWFCLMQL